MSAVATTALTPNIKDQQATVLLHILRSWVYTSAQILVIVRFSWFYSIPPGQLEGQYIKWHHDSFLQHKKGKVFRVEAMKSYKGRRGIAVLILNLCTRRRSAVTASRQVYSRTSWPSRCPSNRMFWGR
jgi:hypothetical protein